MTSNPLSIKQAMQLGVTILGTHLPSVHHEVELLLQHTLKVSRAYLYTYTEMYLNNEQIVTYQHYLNERARGVPIAYILGHRDFWTLRLPVTPDTLIPRPETELLVEKALELLDANVNLAVLDLGTGSGAIALALASERPNWHISAIDKQVSALTVARQTAHTLGCNNITFICSDWFQALGKQLFHAILSNPPYLAKNDPHLQQGDLRFEPQTALVSGDDGLEALHFIIKNGYNHLHDQGILCVEHGCEQGASVSALFAQYGYKEIHLWKDWQGHDRITCGKRNI